MQPAALIEQAPAMRRPHCGLRICAVQEYLTPKRAPAACFIANVR